jgi:hypothetical protein
LEIETASGKDRRVTRSFFGSLGSIEVATMVHARAEARTPSLPAGEQRRLLYRARSWARRRRANSLTLAECIADEQRTAYHHDPKRDTPADRRSLLIERRHARPWNRDDLPIPFFLNPVEADRVVNGDGYGSIRYTRQATVQLPDGSTNLLTRSKRTSF